MAIINENPGEHLRCLLMMHELPGDQVANVRNPPRGLRGWITRIEEKLTRQVFPDIRTASHVRGNRVAQDYLFQALLGHNQSAHFSFVVEEPKRSQFEQWAAKGSHGDGHRPIEVHSAIELREPGLDRIAPDIWLDLRGQADYGLRVRDQLSSSVYPVVSLQHGLADPSLLYDYFLRIMLTPTYACDSLVCTSRASKKALANIFEEMSASFKEQFGTSLGFAGRLDLIPLCVDTDLFQPLDKSQARKQLGIPNDSVVLLYIGYLSLIKADFAPLLPMIRKLADDNPNIDLRLILAGTGPDSYSKSLLVLIQELHLQKHVSLLREVSDKSKHLLFGAADVFVAPCDSLHESFGLTPIEAMAYGVPQVVADWDGYRDTVSHGETGFLVPTCWGRCDRELHGTGELFGWVYDHTLMSQSVSLDIEYMRDCLQTLIRNPDLRSKMSQQSRTRAVAEFGCPKVAYQYDQLWGELSAIARTQERYRKSRRFDQIAYFNIFGHFSTTQLTDQCVIRTTSNGLLPIPKITSLAETELQMHVFDDALLDQIIQDLSPAEGNTGGKSAGQILSQMTNETRSTEMVRRHILLLLKHGKVEVISSPGANSQ